MVTESGLVARRLERAVATPSWMRSRGKKSEGIRAKWDCALFQLPTNHQILTPYESTGGFGPSKSGLIPTTKPSPPSKLALIMGSTLG